jgi:N4-gp56 family major capsid protein
MTASGAEGVPTTAVGLTAANVTGSTAQYDQAVSISDLLAYTSFGDVTKAAMERLAYNAGLSVEDIIINEVKASGCFLSPESTISALAAYTGLSSTAKLDITGVKKSVRKLQANHAKPAVGGFFVATIHPYPLYDLQADTTVGGWITSNIYTEPNADKLMAGEIGSLHGVKFLRADNDAMIYGSSLAANSGNIYTTNFFGSDAFGVTELQNLKTYVKGFESGGTGDPTEKVATVGWKTCFGASTLNSAFFVNYFSNATA